jgi:uncharacterized repeat protein (TIGR02543 family)
MNKRWISIVMAVIILWGMIPTFASAASTDHWVSQNSDNPVTSNQDVCYGNGKFMAVTDEGAILTSIDGTSWTYYKPVNTQRLSSINCDNGKFVAVTRAGLASSSSDVLTWKTGYPLNDYLFLWGVTYGNGLYVAVGNKIDDRIGAIYTSTTNEEYDIWTDRNVTTPSVLKGVTYGNQRFVAVGQSGTILFSNDGVSWTSSNSGTAADLQGVKYLNGKFVSWARDGKTILTSVDGTSWNLITTSGLICPDCASVNSGVLHSVSYGNGTYVGVGSFNSIYTSSDLVSWTKKHEGDYGSLNGVTYGNGTFIAVGNNGDIFQNIDLPTYTVTYNGNGNTEGTVPTDSNPYEQNETVTVLGNTGSLLKTGHTFAGWNTAADGTGTPYAANATFGMGAANVMLYAQWTVNPTYTVTYNGNGSTGGTVPTDSHSYAQYAPVTVLGNTGSLVKTGNTFAGWNTAANGSGTSYAAGDTFSMAAANVTLYAQWTVNPTYTVTYNGNGSTGGTVPTDSNPYEQHATVTVLGNTGSLVKTGSTFAGWNTAADGSGTSYAANATFSMAAANVTLYAQWTANPTYTVTYNGNGSTGGTVPTDNNPYEQSATVTVLGNTGSLVKTGHTFAGWNTAADGTGTPYAANATFGMGAANVTLYAQWTVNPTYTVTYNGNGSTGGTVPTDSNPYEQSATVTVLGNTGSLLKTGSTFAGWNTAADGSGTSYAAGATFSMAAANVTLYAQWTANPTYTVTYNGNGSTGGTVPTDSNPYEQSATVTILGNTGSLVKTGNTFAGWNTSADGSGTSYAAGATFTVAAANVTLYAQWTAIPGSGDGGSPTPPDDSKVISKNGELSLPAGRMGEVSLGDAITIDIPANATNKELKLTIEKLTETEDLVTDEDVLASPIFEILKNFSENFSKPITLTFKFDPTKLSGNQRAAVFYYEEAQKKWVEVGGVVKGNQITAVVNHFTKFAVMVVGQAASKPKPTINFSDISEHWAKANIKQAVSSGIVTGYQDGTFKPDKAVTRAEFAVMLMNALKTEGAGAALTFTDTAKIGSWAQRAVARAVHAGIINGYEDGTFRPDGEITRAELAAMIAGALGENSEGNATATSFADDKDIPAWAKAAVAYVKQASIMQGKGDNQFAPGDPATRAEAVTVLLNMLAHKSK